HALNFEATPAEYYARANDELLVVLQCEHVRAVEGADRIFGLPRVDAVFVGPNDLAASMRGKDGSPPSAEATAQAMAHVFAVCRRHGVAAGVHVTTAEEARRRVEEGWQFLAVGSELRMMLDGAHAVLDGLGLGRRDGLARY